MNAGNLYVKLDHDFIKLHMSDEWSQDMASTREFLCAGFIERSMGLVCDFADNIDRVYTAVFPSTRIMKQLLASDADDAMLFVHHPMAWDIRNAPDVFTEMDRDLLVEFRKRRISVYCLHVPLDDYGQYSTSVTLSTVLDTQPSKAFAPYYGVMCGVIAHTRSATVEELLRSLTVAVGHDARLYRYGSSEIVGGKVAIIAGGGNDATFLAEVASAGLNVLLTGITAENDYSRAAHEYAQANRISLIGGTHYSTEKFACIAMTAYFSDFGLTAEFIDDEPVLEDM